MDGLLEAARTVGLWSGTILWVGLLLLSCFAILISLPGGWIALALAVLFDLLHGFRSIGWQRLLLFAALLTVGEIIEAFLGSLYVAKKGATRYGVVGTFVGGILRVNVWIFLLLVGAGKAARYAVVILAVQGALGV